MLVHVIFKHLCITWKYNEAMNVSKDWNVAVVLPTAESESFSKS